MNTEYWDDMFRELWRGDIACWLRQIDRSERYVAQEQIVAPPGGAACQGASAEECPAMPGWTHEELARGWKIAEPPSLGPYEGIARFPYRWAPAAPYHDGGCMT